MPREHTIEPIAPTTIPGEPLDPKIPPDQRPESDEHEESDQERQARESEKALDQALTRMPPG